MTVDVPEFCELERWWRAGKPPMWTSWVIALACAMTVAVAWVGAHRFATMVRCHDFVVRDGLALAFAALVAWCWLGPSRLSGALRVVVMMPAAHAIAIACAWAMGAWGMRGVPWVDAEPLALAALAAGSATLVAARALVGRRRRDWLHVATTIALVHVVAAACWLPIVVDTFGHAVSADEWLVPTGPAFAAWLWLPPFVVAAGYAILAFRWPDMLRRWRDAAATLAVVAIANAVAMNARSTFGATETYVGLVGARLALVFVAACAVAALGAVTWWQTRRHLRAVARAALVGTVATRDDGDRVVASLQIDGWLRGPRLLTRPFVVDTRDGSLPIDGAEVVAMLPAVSTCMASGQCVAVLRAGDRVRIAGYEARAGGDPFRTSTTFVSSDRVRVARDPSEPAGLAETAFAVWRPCVTYLLVATAAALPGLVAAARMHG